VPVWPQPKTVNVVGDWNGLEQAPEPWRRGASPASGRIRQGDRKGTKYNSNIEGQGGYSGGQGGSVAIMRNAAATASVVWTSTTKWAIRSGWSSGRAARSTRHLHLRDAHRVLGRGRKRNRPLNYRELAEPLSDY